MGSFMTTFKPFSSLSFLLGLAAATSAAGCVRKKEPEASPAPTTLASNVAAQPTLSPPHEGGAALPGRAGDMAMNVEQRFAQEARDRPDGGGPRVEAVYAAFTKAGLVQTEQRQHAAGPFGAAYCVGAKYDADVHASVCEYPSEEAAEKGREGSLKSFQKVPNRDVLRHGTTTLTLRQGAKTPASEAKVKKMIGAFEKL